LKRKGYNLTSSVGIGYCIVDSLDTMILMNLTDEVKEARRWINDTLSFNVGGQVKFFEVVIRILGGLLSAYHLSGNDQLYLDRAVDLADRLAVGYNARQGTVAEYVNLKTGAISIDSGILAELGSIQLEFKYLAHLTGDVRYWKMAEKVSYVLANASPLDGMLSDNYPLQSYQSDSSFAGGADSYYEYLVKQYLQTGQQEPAFLDLYHRSTGALKTDYTARVGNLTFIGKRHGYGAQVNQMDHLACFVGGTLALGSQFNANDMEYAQNITESCYWMYQYFPTGLSPEAVRFYAQPNGTNATHSFRLEASATYNDLRPETIESLFYLWRLTKDDKYRHWGWDIFQAFEKHSKVKTGGYTQVKDVRKLPVKQTGNMETFFFAETLKYFYLLFDDDGKIPLDQYVFNTEAHPIPVFTPRTEWIQGWTSHHL